MTESSRITVRRGWMAVLLLGGVSGAVTLTSTVTAAMPTPVSRSSGAQIPSVSSDHATPGMKDWASGTHAVPSGAGLDRSGKKRVGKASVYAKRLDGRTMADGSALDVHQSFAASKTLPLGTTAKVTNLKTGKSAVVVIKDRGPYVDGRIVDLSPRTARQIGITPDQGVGKVEIAPIVVPLKDGRVKLGAGAGTGALATSDSAATPAPR